MQLEWGRGGGAVLVAGRADRWCREYILAHSRCVADSVRACNGGALNCRARWTARPAAPSLGPGKREPKSGLEP